MLCLCRLKTANGCSRDKLIPPLDRNGAFDAIFGIGPPFVIVDLAHGDECTIYPILSVSYMFVDGQKRCCCQLFDDC